MQQGTPEDIVLNPANEYVRAFVAHMNPLNVLRAASFMRQAGPEDRTDGLVRAAPDALLRDVMQLRESSGGPVAIADGDRIVGITGDAEIYHAILRQTGVGG